MRLLRFAPSVALLALVAPALAAPQDPASDRYYRAYFLEHERGSLDQAAELYGSVAGDESAEPELRDRARRALAAIAEERAAGDFARLVPEDTILYLELGEPGGQLASLLGQLGLMGDDGSLAAGEMKVSPALVEGLLGLRGAAVALTHVDPTGGPPNGVVMLHPGDLEVVRGLIETALPAGGRLGEPVAGRPCYVIEEGPVPIYVALGEELVVAGPDRELMGEVLGRVGADDASGSLAGNEELSGILSERGDDLLFFCLNAEPLMDVVQAMLGQVAAQSQEAALALALADVGSVEAIAGRMGVTDDGLAMDVTLQMDEDHRSLAFDLMRMPPLEQGSLELVPSGAAAWVTSCLNPAGEPGALLRGGGGRPAVGFMDVGRELFANVRDVAFYVMPTMMTCPNGMPVPDFALAMRVNDPERSAALWGTALGVVQAAAGGAGLDPARVSVGDLPVARFTVQGLPVFVAAGDGRVVVTPSEAALRALGGGASVIDDPAFSAAVRDLDVGTIEAWGLAPGRLVGIARAYVPEREQAEMEQVMALIQDTTIVASTLHTNTTFSMRARVRNLPDLSGVVQSVVQARRGNAERFVAARAAEAEGMRREAELHAARAEKARRLAEAPAFAPEAVAVEADAADDAAALRGRFDTLVRKGEIDAARESLRALKDAVADDPTAQNDLAWNLLTEDVYGGHFLAEALDLSRRSNEATDWENWRFLDTMAHGLAAAGEVESAIEMQERAVEKAEGHPRAGEAVAALERFRKLDR